MNLVFVINLILCVLLFSCSEYKEEYIDGDDLIPPAPPFWEYFTVDGSDVDQDGVRDDYELLVNEEFDSYNLRKAFKEEAKLEAKFLKAKTTEEAIVLREKIQKIFGCQMVLKKYETKDSSDELLELSRRYRNNYWRKNKFNKTFRKLIPSGAYFVGATGQDHEIRILEECGFEVQGKRQIIENIIDFYRRGRVL